MFSGTYLFLFLSCLFHTQLVTEAVAFNYTCSTNVTIISGTSEVPDGAFRNCFILRAVTITDSVISIGNNTLYYDFPIHYE